MTAGTGAVVIYNDKEAHVLGIINVRLFLDGDIQTVRIPDKYGFQSGEVYIPQDPPAEDLILSEKPPCHRSLRCLRSWLRPEPLTSSWIVISPYLQNERSCDQLRHKFEEMRKPALGSLHFQDKVAHSRATFTAHIATSAMLPNRYPAPVSVLNLYAPDLCTSARFGLVAS